MGSMVFRWFWGKTTIGNDGFRWLRTIGPTMEWLCTIVEVYCYRTKVASPMITVNRGIPPSVIVGETFIAKPSRFLTELIPPFRIFLSEFWNAKGLRATPHFLGASCILYLERNAPAAFNHTSIIVANSSTTELESP